MGTPEKSLTRRRVKSIHRIYRGGCSRSERSARVERLSRAAAPWSATVEPVDGRVPAFADPVVHLDRVHDGTDTSECVKGGRRGDIEVALTSVAEGVLPEAGPGPMGVLGKPHRGS